MANTEEYLGNQIDWRKEGSIEDLGYNPIPMEKVSMEKIFDRNDRCKQKKDTTRGFEYEEVNIGSQEDPCLIKIGKTLYP